MIGQSHFPGFPCAKVQSKVFQFLTILINTLAIKSPQAFQLDPWWKQFVDKEIEEEFQSYAVPLHAIALQRMLLVGGLAWLWFAINDVMLGDGLAHLALTLPFRLFCGGSCFFMWWYLGHGKLTATGISNVATSASALCLGGIPVLLYLAPTTGLPLAMLSVMVTIAAYLLIPNQLSRAVIISVPSNLAFLLVAAAMQTYTQAELVVAGVVLSSVNVFSFIVAQDIQRTWRREFQAYVEQQRVSIHDHLTGCLNRRYLSEMLLPSEIERARRYKTWLSIVVCDADHFKLINDTYGHLTGDAVLREFANVLQAGTRHGIDSVVRFGGEEFLLLLPNTDLSSAVRTAERLRKTIADTTITGELNQPIRVTASFGVCGINFAEENANERELISASDHYLYKAKNAGRNTVCFGGMPNPDRQVQ